MSKSAINIKGRGLTVSGFLNVSNMTIESEEFTMPIKLSKLCKMADLDDSYVKINITEVDTPIEERDYVEAEKNEEEVAE